MSHDFAAQRAETFDAFAEMIGDGGLPDVADLDFFFVATAQPADWAGLAAALEQADFMCDWVDDVDEGEAPYLVATLADQPVSAKSIWVAEETATRVALQHGFTPDGWALEG